MYWDVSNIYGWQILQKLAVDVFEWRQEKFIFDEELLQDYREDRDKIYILEVDVEYPKNLYELNSDLSFLPKRMKTEKCKKLLCNLCNEENYAMYIIALKQELDHELILEKKR